MATGCYRSVASLDEGENVSMDIFCSNDDVYCKCRSCTESQINGGACSHCLCCIDGEKDMDNCEGYKNNGDVIWKK